MLLVRLDLCDSLHRFNPCGSHDRIINRKTVMKKYLVASGSVFAMFLIACGSPSSPNDEDINRLNNHATAPSVTITVSPTNVDVISNETTQDWKVGTKDNFNAGILSPGSYIVVSGSTTSCYWARVKGFDGELDSIISNGNIEAGSTARVTVKKTDKGLTLQGDCAATKDKS